MKEEFSVRVSASRKCVQVRDVQLFMIAIVCYRGKGFHEVGITSERGLLV
jgi:hypothetical protein